jgi:outer membrane protein assembly factor BamB
MKKVSIPLQFVCLSWFIILLSSCGSGNVAPANVDLTATSDQATQIYLCCTAAPLPTETSTPFPSTNSLETPDSSNIVLSRGNPQRTGVYDTSALRNQPEVKWQTKLGSTLFISPLVVDDILYTGSDNGTLHALNLETGEEIWSVDGFGHLENSGAVSGNVILAGGYSRTVKALDRHTGKELWSFQTENMIQAAPLIVGKRVYIATYHAVYALELDSGSLSWEVPTGDEDAFMGPPAYDDGVIYTTGGNLLLALEADTGEEIWRVEKDEMFLALAVANGLIYAGNWNKAFYAFDQGTGEEHWKFQAEGELWLPPAAYEDTVYVGNGNTLYALNAQTGEERWSFKTTGNLVSESIIAEDVIYFTDGNHETRRGPHHLYALDGTTGTELWTFEVTSTFLPAPALGDGVIYLTSTGEVMALAASAASNSLESPDGADIVLSRANTQRTGVYKLEAIRQQPQVKWQTKVTESWLMPPLVAEGILYAGSGDGVLYALNADTGEQLWSAGGFEGLESTGAIAKDRIITGGFSTLVRAFERQTGELLWSFQAGYPVQGAPLIVEDRVIIATDHEVYSLSLESGQLIWKKATGKEGAFMGAPAYDDGVIYTTSGKLLLALEAATGKEIWHVEKDEMFLGLAVANQTVYVGNWDRHLYAFDQLSGAERWSFKAGGEFWSAPAVDENTVYAGNIDRFLYALNAGTGELRWSFETSSDAVSEPLVADGVVYVSDSSHLFPMGKRHLYALDAAIGEELWSFETTSTFLPAPELGKGVIYVTSSGEVIALQ